MSAAVPVESKPIAPLAERLPYQFPGHEMLEEAEAFPYDLLAAKAQIASVTRDEGELVEVPTNLLQFVQRARGDCRRHGSGSAVHVNSLPGEVACPFGHQVADDIRDLFRLANVSERH